MAGVLTNGLPLLDGGSAVSNYPQVLGYETLPMDTGLASGQVPQTVAVRAFHIAALYAALAATVNAVTASSGAATLSKVCGIVTTETLTTAAGATYTLTLTNTLVKATSNVLAVAYLGTGVGSELQVTSITPAAGSVVIVVTVVGTVALSGTAVMKIPFMVQNAI